jgi:protein associated with RNAse G/E
VGEKVRLVFTKYDGRLHWHAWLTRLGEDEHGVWLAAPTGTVWQRGSEPVVQLPASVTLIPRDVWWVASFNVEPAKFEAYVDLTSVAVWHGDEVTMIDLDLDVVRYRGDGAVRLLDEDEFVAHRLLFGYPDTLVHSVTETAGRLMSDVVAAEPFAGAYRRWLAQVS